MTRRLLGLLGAIFALALAFSVPKRVHADVMCDSNPAKRCCYMPAPDYDECEAPGSPPGCVCMEKSMYNAG
jgi:hypothetical protein